MFIAFGQKAPAQLPSSFNPPILHNRLLRTEPDSRSISAGQHDIFVSHMRGSFAAGLHCADTRSGEAVFR